MREDSVGAGKDDHCAKEGDAFALRIAAEVK
jgi:hypothetical protein